MTTLTMSLAGRVRLTDADGRDRTPVSMKARGLLALLGSAREYRMSRAKLQDKLWSDRAPEQGSASLRQALAEIRGGLGPHREALLGGPGWVGLDPALVEVALWPAADVVPGTIEFAEDLAIADPEFADWLLVERQRFDDLWSRAAVRGTPRRLAEPACLILAPARTGHDDLDLLADVVLREAAAHAADLLPILVVDERSAAGVAQAVRAEAAGTSRHGGPVLQVTVTRLHSGRQLALRTFHGRAAVSAGAVQRIAAEVALAVLAALATPDDADPAGRSVRLADVFSFSAERLAAADGTLAGLPETHEVLSLRAFIRNTQYLERLGDDRRRLAEASEFASRALELAPYSATTLAVASIVASQRGDVPLAGDLAQRALRINPANPLARTGLSLALVAAGQAEKAHAEALRAREEPLAALSPASWAAFCAVTAIRTHRFEEARRFAQISHGYAPGYRPALRFLAALRFRLGDEAGAADALRKLGTIEPDFSLGLMASADYPVASLRAAGLLDVTRSGLL